MLHLSFKDSNIECFLPASPMKRAADPRFKGSKCGIASTPLEAGAFIFSQKEEVNRSRHEGPKICQILLSSLSSIKRKDELKPKVHICTYM